MPSHKNRIENLKSNGYSLSFDSVLNLAFKNYKKIVLYAGLLFFVFAVVMAILVSIVLINQFGADQLEQILKPENINPDNLKGDTKNIFLGASVLVSVVLSPFMAGFIKMAYCADRDQEFHVSTIFEYYTSKHLFDLLLATFIISTVNTGLPLLNEQPQFQVVISIVSYLILFMTFLTIPLIIFSNLKAIPAIKTSIQLFAKQPLALFALILLAYVLSVVGFFVFYIGIFFTIPFLYAMHFALYCEVVGFDLEKEQEVAEI